MSLHLSAGDDSPYETGGGPSCKKLKQEFDLSSLGQLETSNGQLWALLGKSGQH
jgi:hypothetical protein